MQPIPIIAIFTGALLISGGTGIHSVGMSAIRAAGWGTSRPVLAAEPLPCSAAQETMNFTVEGKISKHTGQKLTLSTEGNIIFHVIYNEKTSITHKDGSAGTAKDLQVGTRIHVDGELTEAGEIIAKKITIQSEPAGEKR